MITNHILEDKWKVQKELSEQAGHDLGRYIALIHRKVEEAEERYGIRFRYTEHEVSKPRRGRIGSRSSGT